MGNQRSWLGGWAWLAVPKRSKSREGLAWRSGGCKGSRGGAGGRGTGPRDGANFATCVVSNAYKQEKWLFLKYALWGGGVPTGAGLVDGVDQGP